MCCSVCCVAILLWMGPFHLHSIPVRDGNRCLTGEPLPEIKSKLNPVADNLAWIRGMDFLPVFTTMNTINSSIKALEERRRRL